MITALTARYADELSQAMTDVLNDFDTISDPKVEERVRDNLQLAEEASRKLLNDLITSDIKSASRHYMCGRVNAMAAKFSELLSYEDTGIFAARLKKAMEFLSESLERVSSGLLEFTTQKAAAKPVQDSTSAMGEPAYFPLPGQPKKYLSDEEKAHIREMLGLTAKRQKLSQYTIGASHV